MASLSELSRDLAALVERAGGSVVRVDARRGRPASGIVFNDNLVLTADHVVEQEDSIQVSAGGAAVKASIAGRDPGTDLALLRTEGLSASPAPRGKSAEARVGQLVVALGRPGELQVTVGIVSGLSGSFRSWRGAETERLIQTTAGLLPGFSGGPLLDADGRVIGMNSWHFGQGVSRAIPVETVEKVVDSLRQYGRIRRAYLGVGTQPVRLGDALKSQLGQEAGLLVVTVEAGGPAASAGLMQGDIIVALDGNAVRQLDDLFRALRRLEVGSSHTLRVARAGELKELSVKAGERTS
jgi:serine protease DegQ